MSFSGPKSTSSGPIKKERSTVAVGSIGLGDRVSHDKFGTGTIVALSGPIADIAFPG